MSGQTWTDSQDALLRRSLIEGLSFKQVCMLIGVTRNSAIGRAHRLGIKGEPRQASSANARARNLHTRILRNVKAPIRLPRTPGLPALQFAPPVERAASVIEGVPIGPGRPLMDLPWNGCRFAVTQDDAAEHLFCGAEKAPDRSWCPAHCKIAFAPPRKRANISDEERHRRKIQGLKNIAAGVFR